MRKIKILNLNPGTPASITVGSDYTSIFNGEFYRIDDGTTYPKYTSPIPTGGVLIAGTTFDVIQNTKYTGKYSVYTPISNLDTPSSIFSGITIIYINEIIPLLDIGESLSLSSDGYITNISTYLLYTGTSNIVISPGVNNTSYPIEFMGRGSSGWGEAQAQNFINITRNFANALEPINPFFGQTWFNADDHQIRVYNGTSFELVNRSSFGVTFRHTQGSSNTTWTVNHLLALPAPFIAFTQFFIDQGSGPEQIIPENVSFMTTNQLVATFSVPVVGYALVRG